MYVRPREDGCREDAGEAEHDRVDRVAYMLRRLLADPRFAQARDQKAQRAAARKAVAATCAALLEHYEKLSRVWLCTERYGCTYARPLMDAAAPPAAHADRFRLPPGGGETERCRRGDEGDALR